MSVRSGFRLQQHSAVLIMGLAMFPILSAAAAAQDESETTPTEAAATSTVSPLPPPSIRYLPGPDGNLVPVPANASLEEYLKSLEKDPEPEPQVHYSIAELDLSGEATGDRAKLRAEIVIRLNSDNQWVQVPLQMADAVITGAEAESPGEASYDAYDRTTGYRWWIKGSGEHRLTLDLLVPIRRQVPGRRLQLSLPEAAVSRMALSVDEQNLDVRVGGDRSATNVTESRSGTEIEVFGLGSRLDLLWQPQPEETSVQTVLEAESSISILLNPTDVVIDALQQVRALQGTLGSVEVAIPPSMQVIDVSGKRYRSHRRHEDGRVTVELTEETSEAVQLKWQLAMPLEGANEFVFTGLSVAKARKQTGVISVGTIEGYRVTSPDEQQPNVVRINIGEVTASGMSGTPARAYRFLKQPFQLRLKSDRIEPYFLAEPVYVVTFEPEQMTLSARFPFRVFRGSVSEAMFEWPNFQEEGWTLDSLGPPGLVEEIEPTTVSGTEQISARLIGSQNADFELELLATRPLKPGEGIDSEVTWTLPFPRVSSPQPGVLVVANAENLETTVEPVESQSVRPLSSVSREQLQLPAEIAELPKSDYRLAEMGPSFKTRLKVRQGTVDVASRAELIASDDALRVRQTLVYDIAYERLSELRLLVPDHLSEDIRFETLDGESLSASINGSTDGNRREAVIRLAEPVLGEVSVVAVYDVPAAGNADLSQEQSFVIPFVQAAEAPTEELTFRVVEANNLEGTVVSENWTARSNGASAAEWRSIGNPRDVTVQLRQTRAKEPRAGVAPRAIVRAAVDADGTVRTWTQAQIRLERPRIRFRVPPDMEILGAWWGRQPLDVEVLASDETGQRTMAVTLPEDDLGSTGLLTMDARSEGERLRWFGAVEIDLPDLSPDVSVVHSMIRLVLPINQHLLMSPAEVTPQFQWKWKSLYWARQTQPAWSFVEHWIGAERGPEAPPLFVAGHEYGFSRFGALRVGSVATMSQSVILLVGAGFALLIGLVLLRIPASRHATFALLLVFGLAVVGLWYMEPLELLFQPALVGTVLAVMAVVIDVVVRRRHAPPVVTFSHSGDYRRRLSDSSLARPRSGVGAHVGSEDSTQERPASTGSRSSEVVPS